MRIGIFSDTHFGFGEGTERESESFENGLKAFKLCFGQKVDAIIIPGDVFDEALPSPETLSRAFDVFLNALKQPKSQVKVTTTSKHGEKEFDFFGVPVIVIHGNHDCRSIGKTNILEVFSKSNFLAYLSPGKAFIEKGNEKVCVHGFSAVPEKKAFDVLKLLDPKPEKADANILIMHQSFREFLPFVDDMIATLSLEDLPKGFDLIVNGHLHWTDVQKLENATFLLAGSTVTTQMKKLEAVREKGVFVFDSVSKSLDFFPLPDQRKLFYHKLKFENAKPQEIVFEAKRLLDESISKNESSLPPLVRLKLEGSLALGVNSSDISFTELLDESKGKAIVSISKSFFSASFKKKIADLRSLQKSRQSVASLGFEILEKNLEETDFADSFDVRTVFDLLAENEIEKASEVILGKKQ